MHKNLLRVAYPVRTRYLFAEKLSCPFKLKVSTELLNDLTVAQ